MNEPNRRLRRVALPKDARTRFMAGVGVLVMALVLFGASRLIARTQHHAYDPQATPPSSVHLTAGKQYQLSTPGGVGVLKAQGLLSATNRPFCSAAQGSLPGPQLAFTRVGDDERDLTVFASFRAPATGEFRVQCQGIPKVFVDDADDASFDWSGLLVLVSTALAVAGVGVSASGLYLLGLESERESESEREPARKRATEVPDIDVTEPGADDEASTGPGSASD